VLKDKVLEVAALYLACGIDPKKSHIFVQSENPNHPYLAWILNTITPFGQLERMTQFKDKSNKHEANAGLFDYPVLMASDILLYQTDEVPVGEDQKQHIELTRDLAEKFNARFGQTFKLPVPIIQKQTARIMSLQNPTQKMSKSDNDPLGTINLLDTEEKIREKIKKAVTDSESKISKDTKGKAILNLLSIYSSFKNHNLEKSISELEGKSYSEFKNILSEIVVEHLGKIQKKYKHIREDEASLRKILNEGRDFAIEKSTKILEDVKEKVGL
jgi:tryptophanyl-tRNA synthetase